MRNTVRFTKNKKDEISGGINALVNIPQYKRERIDRSSSTIHLNFSLGTTHWHSF